MWCLCLCSARSLCSSLTNLTSASPFLRPWAFRQSAAPPLWKKQNRWQMEEKHRGERTENPVLLWNWAKQREENQLGNIESFEEPCNILIRRLPGQASSPHHCVVINKFHLAAVNQTQLHVAWLMHGKLLGYTWGLLRITLTCNPNFLYILQTCLRTAHKISCVTIEWWLAVGLIQLTHSGNPNSSFLAVSSKPSQINSQKAKFSRYPYSLT